ncbi:hypothetical protein Tco_1577886 [Tanacetum coccineum]
MAKDPSIPRRNKVNWHYARDDPTFTTINVISRNEDTQLYGAILPTKLTNEDIRISKSYKKYHAIASGKIPPKTKGSKKKANTDTTTKMKPPTVPKEKKEKKSGKGKNWCYTPDAPEYDSDNDISWKLSDDDQDDKKAQDDEDEAHTKSEDNGDDFIYPKLTIHDDEIIHEEETNEDDTFDPIVHTPSRISSSDEEDSDNEVEGMDVEGAKLDDDATYVEDQGNEAVEDTNANLEGRDDVMTDVILPQSSSLSSGFVSNMLNPNQDTGVDAIFGQHAEATSLIDTHVTAIAEPSFSAPTNYPPTPKSSHRGSKRRRSGKEPESTSAPREKTTTTAGKTTTGSKTHKQSASQSAPAEETMQSTDVFDAPAHQEFETGVHDEQAEEEVHHLPDWFQQPKRLPSPDQSINKSVTCRPTFELMKGTCKSLTELEYFCEEVYKATTEKLDWINPEGRQYPHDLRKPLPLVLNSQGRLVILFHHFINNDLKYLRGGESSSKYSTLITKTKVADYGHIK